MRKNTDKKAFWADELPSEVKAIIKRAKISALIQNFKKFNDPFCIALLCDELTIKPDEAEAMATIRQFAFENSFKKGFSYELQKGQVLMLWDMLKGKDTDGAVREIISSECKISSEAIRKIIEKR